MNRKQAKFKSDLDFLCPFCGLPVSASLKSGAITHVMPMCEKFEKLWPDEYLKAARIKITGAN